MTPEEIQEQRQDEEMAETGLVPTSFYSAVYGSVEMQVYTFITSVLPQLSDDQLAEIERFTTAELGYRALRCGPVPF